MSKLNLELEKHEALMLTILLNGTLGKLESHYEESKNDSSFLKDEALSEIEDLKALIGKVEVLL
jgi:hypothetical protein